VPALAFCISRSVTVDAIAREQLSGLCTHPDSRGKGFGKTMMRFVAGEISARGGMVYLYSDNSNSGAIAFC
jgi:ribosomal protein S18 acetylase RimI-like enzyme